MAHHGQTQGTGRLSDRRGPTCPLHPGVVAGQSRSAGAGRVPALLCGGPVQVIGSPALPSGPPEVGLRPFVAVVAPGRGSGSCAAGPCRRSTPGPNLSMCALPRRLRRREGPAIHQATPHSTPTAAAATNHAVRPDHPAPTTTTGPRPLPSKMPAATILSTDPAITASSLPTLVAFCRFISLYWVKQALDSPARTGRAHAPHPREAARCHGRRSQPVPQARSRGKAAGRPA